MKKCGSDGEAGDKFACRMYIACRGYGTKCHRTKSHGHVMSRTKFYEDEMLLVKMSSYFVHDILSNDILST